MLLTSKEIRSRLVEVEAEISRVRRRIELLDSIRQSYCSLLSTSSQSEGHRRERTHVPRLYSAVRDVLRGAGRPMHAKDVAAAVQALGVVIDHPYPYNPVLRTCYALRNVGHPVRKVAPGTWVWEDPGRAQG